LDVCKAFGGRKGEEKEAGKLFIGRGDGKEADAKSFDGACERFGAGEKRRAGRDDVIHEQKVLIAELFGMLYAKDILYVEPTFLLLELSLRSVADFSEQMRRVKRNVELGLHALGNDLGLVVAAKELPASVQRNGNDAIDLTQRTVSFCQLLRRYLAQPESYLAVAVVFQCVDHPLRAVVFLEMKAGRCVFEAYLSGEELFDRVFGDEMIAGEGKIAEAMQADLLFAGRQQASAAETSLGKEQVDKVVEAILPSRQNAGLFFHGRSG
jgi:hypothetical protein